jgi:hypothetical protein
VTQKNVIRNSVFMFNRKVVKSEVFITVTVYELFGGISNPNPQGILKMKAEVSSEKLIQI